MSQDNEWKQQGSLLAPHIIALSVADDWETARDEWTLLHVYRAISAEQCLCGHQPILKICVIKNTKNGKTAKVGNCCVNKFMQIASDIIFNAIDRISKDNTKAANRPLLDMALAQGAINQQEFELYVDSIDKRKLTQQQRQTRESINAKLLGMAELNHEVNYTKETIQQAQADGVISLWECEFAIQTFPMTKVSDKQNAIRAHIETKMMLAGIRRCCTPLKEPLSIPASPPIVPTSPVKKHTIDKLPLEEIKRLIIMAIQQEMMTEEEATFLLDKLHYKGRISVTDRSSLFRLRAVLNQLSTLGK